MLNQMSQNRPIQSIQYLKLQNTANEARERSNEYDKQRFVTAKCVCFKGVNRPAISRQLLNKNAQTRFTKSQTPHSPYKPSQPS